MNILLWILQGALALLCLSGGGYKAFNSADLVKRTRALSGAGWTAIGAIEMVCGVLLVVPATVAWGAAVVTLESLFLSAIYGRVSTRLITANPLVWSGAMTLIAAFVVWHRYGA